MSNYSKINKSCKNQKTYKQKKLLNENVKKLKKQKSCENLEKASTTDNNCTKDIKINQRKPYSHKSLTLVNKKLSEVTKNERNFNQQIPLSDRDYDIPKMERSKSFFLTRKISEMLNHLSSSKENLSTAPSLSPKEKSVNSNNAPYQFIRSKSMILLRTSKRKNYGPQLEKLSEESERPNSPVQIFREQLITEESLKEATTVTTAPMAIVSDNAAVLSFKSVPNNSTSALKTNTFPLIKESNVEFRRTSWDSGMRPASATVSVDFAISDRRKSSGVFKDTLKRIVTTERRKSVNARWSASLQSLQEIDNMVSYENLSFIDYDKFNEYEKQLNRLLVPTGDYSLTKTPEHSPISPRHFVANIADNVRFRKKKGRSSLNKEYIPKSFATVENNKCGVPLIADAYNNWQTYSLDDQKLIEIGENFHSDFRKLENYTNNYMSNSAYSSSDIIDFSSILRKKVPNIQKSVKENCHVPSGIDFNLENGTLNSLICVIQEQSSYFVTLLKF
ncbi:uncharacterized protein LOC129616539 [Condylostylus longicornis]|uniref:uncharacterized protein LOC129616539 n=1 Tax=Condylostylus longicornis TaxID=2530218 RepID=UPI00244DF1E3|nr:uncharacterized protein LOC129616539 [Condylostylus longicornis]